MTRRLCQLLSSSP